MNYREQDFEDHIVENLINSGYNQCALDLYDKSICMVPSETISFIKNTQPKMFEKLEKQYGSDIENKLIYRLSQEITRRGSLDVFRTGIKDRGCSFNLAYFKPANRMNPEHQSLYSLNRFSVVRQLKYSLKNENSIDVVLFLNGLPVVVMELKNSLTGQFVEDAVKQFKKDREPREQLFQFKRCLVYFAVGNEKVFMTTRLMAEKTRFLPFNLDTENPVNPNGHMSSYLWEDILQPDTLLDLICNYLHNLTVSEKFYKKNEGLVEKTYDIFIFPRFHQLDVVREILEQVHIDGTGHNYLIQHSAGSGKSNSIAWLAYKLASFYQHPDDKDRLFDSIIVISDRRILDRQLRNTIKQFQQVKGLVQAVDKNAKQLQSALEVGKSIIITTLQKFPVISEQIAQLKGQRFAVIIDEAHSSQSGASASHVQRALNANLEDAEEQDKVDFDLEDKILQEIENRGSQKHISYFAFTATPKNKTLELFGRKNADGKYVAFHIYSMRQAIEEDFILDVLKNYTTFKRYFKLNKAIEADNEYERKKAIRLLTSYVDLQPHAIDIKSSIILDHFLEVTVNAIEGRGRAMVVTRSRLHAVKFYLTLKKIMEEKHLPFKPLVAFSGTVHDPDSGEDYTEKGCNRLPPKVAIPDAFKTPEYRMLVVANKFQTGFDEPTLYCMYVDKKLGGVNAVQTLSRLNRTMRGKTDTVVLDFVNESADILIPFQNYYQTSILEEETDPNKLYTLQSELEQFDVFNKNDIEEFAELFFNPKVPDERYQPVLDRCVLLWKGKSKNEREDFRSAIQSFIRLYGFLSQLIAFSDADLEKLYVFSKNLSRKLPKRSSHLPYEVQDAVDLDSFRIQETFSGSIPLIEDDGKIKGYSNGSPKHTDEYKDLLSAIINELNEIYGTDFSDEDKVDIGKIKNKLQDNEELKAVMNPSNSKENIRLKFDSVLDSLLLEFVHTKLELYKKLTNPKVNEIFKNKWFDVLMEEYYKKTG